MAQFILGIALAALGVAIALNATASIQLFALLVATGLVTAGLLRLVAARDARLPWLDAGVGAVFVALGLAALLVRTAGLRTLALFIAIALAASGLAHLSAAVRGGRGRRVANLLSGLAALIFGGLVLIWPRLTLVVAVLLFGTWLVFTGLSHVLAAVARWRGRAPIDDGVRARRETYAAAASLGVALLVLAGSVFVHAGDARIVPDGFYTPPLDVPDQPGQLIRSEPKETGVPRGARGWRILYTTTTGDGSPAVASGIVIAPATAPAGPSPVLAIAHGTTGIIPRCAPSLTDAPFNNGAATAIAQMVARGWVGVATDYVGLGTAGPHAYLVGEPAARNVLDAVRAAHQMPEIEIDWRTAVWGHSQGGHGALWTGILAPTYAPEIDVIGVAASAPASDLHSLADGIKESAVGKIVVAYIATSWAAVFPDLDVLSRVTLGYRRPVARIGEHCFEGRDAIAAVATSSQLFQPVFRANALDGAIGDRLRANSPTRPIAAPLFIAQGEADRLVLLPAQRAFVAARCAEGQRLEYREYAGRDHMPLVAADSPLTADLVAWTLARLAGEPATSTC